MSSAVDRRLLCQCTEGLGRCDYRATAEDMRCDVCRLGCTSGAMLPAEDVEVHFRAPDFSINWDDLDGDLP